MLSIKERVINTIYEYLTTEDMNATYLKNVKIGRNCYSIVELRDNRFIVPCCFYIAVGIRNNNNICISENYYYDNDKPTERELFDDFEFIFKTLLE